MKIYKKHALKMAIIAPILFSSLFIANAGASESDNTVKKD